MLIIKQKIKSLKELVVEIQNEFELKKIDVICKTPNEIFSIEQNKNIKTMIIDKKMKNKINKLFDLFNVLTISLFQKTSYVASHLKNNYRTI